MRKVITGEQVAQIYNGDPFALPAGGHRSTRPPPGSSCWFICTGSGLAGPA